MEIHLCKPSEQDEDDLKGAWAVLDADERGHAARFAFEQDRLGYVVSHGLMRKVLARITGLTASELRFEKTRHGRPELLQKATEREVRFNLSHARGLVGCAVTYGRELGFDLEEIRRPAPLDIASRYFGPSEVRGLNALEPDLRHERFFAIWTLKEAYMKGRGLGLSLPLRSFAIEPHEHGGADLVLRPDDDPGPWTFRHWRMEDHWMALAVRAGSPEFGVSMFPNQRIGLLQ